MNIVKYLLLLLSYINHSKTLATESEKPLLATVTRRGEGGYRLWPSCNAQSSITKFWSILLVEFGKLQTDAR